MPSDFGLSTGMVNARTASGLAAIPPSPIIKSREAVKRLKAGKETQGEIARSYNVSRWTIARLA